MSRYGGGSDDRYGDKSSYRGGSSGGGGGQYGGGGGGGGGGRFGGGGGGGGGGRGGGGDSMGQLGSGLRQISWDLSKLPVFEKNFYIEHPAVSNRPESVSADWRKSKEITIVGKGIPKPVFSFEEASMPGNNVFFFNISFKCNPVTMYLCQLQNMFSARF